MEEELKKHIDASVIHAEKHFESNKLGNIDCWVMLRLNKDKKIVDEPIAIFRNKERLYEKFEDFARQVDPNLDIVITAWKFD